MFLHFEVCVHKWLGQPGGRIIQQVPAHISFQRVQGFGFDHAIHLLEEFWIRNIQLRKGRRTGRREVTIEIEIGREVNRLIFAHLVIAVLGITAQGAIHRSFGQSSFDPQSGLRGIGRLLR